MIAIEPPPPMPEFNHRALKFSRWAARLAALAVAGAFVALVIGEVAAPHSRPPHGLREWGGIALLSVAALSPAAGWKWKLPAAIVSLVSLLLWGLMFGAPRFYVAAVLAAPGCALALDWSLHRLAFRSAARAEAARSPDSGRRA
jgi:hypothetical protein